MVASKVKKLRVEQWPTSRLIEYPNNPRDNDHAIPRMAASIREFGFRIPIAATPEGLIVDGHLRLKAARHLGLETVPVALVDDLTAEKIKAFRLTANYSAVWAEWNPGLLEVELNDLERLGFDVSPFGLDEILPELEELEPASPRSPRKKTTIFVSVANADAEKARKTIAAALTKAHIEHNQ